MITSLEQLRSHQTWTYFKYAALVSVFLFAYHDAIASLMRIWAGRDNYSHGFLVPFVSIAIVWHKREALKNIPIWPNIFFGLPLTLVSGIVLLAGTVAGISTLQGISLLIMIPGMVWMLFGNQYLKALFFPLLYLVFMVPLFDIVIDKIYQPFQLFSAAMAAFLLNIGHIPVSRHLQYVALPDITLEVAKECSGVSYLISIIAVGIPLSYFTQWGWRRRTALIVISVMIGILTNGFRVFSIGVWAYYGGGNVHGPNHIFQGYFVAVIGFFFLFLIAWMMNRFGGEMEQKISGPARHGVRDIGNSPKRHDAALLLIIILLLALGMYDMLSNSGSVALQKPITQLPLSIDNWLGKDIGYQGIPTKPHVIDSELVRTYRNPAGREVLLYIGYIATQRPDSTFQSFGLKGLANEAEKITLDGASNHTMHVNGVVQKRDGHRFLVYYWYELGSRMIADKNELRLFTIYEGLAHRHTSGAFVMVSSELPDAPENGSTSADMTDFVRTTLPYLESHFTGDGLL